MIKEDDVFNLGDVPLGKLMNRYPWMISLYTKMPQPFAKLIYKSVRSVFAKDPRDMQFNKAFRHIANEKISGDYLEFGVFRGSSMALAHQCARRENLDKMRFFAFDSFAGLPNSEGNVFEKGTMVCEEKKFLKLIAQYGVDVSRVVTVKGWYSESLTPQVKQENNLTQAAVINVDCDLYESTKIVLPFLSNLLIPGSIIIFDDWYHFSHKKHPEQYGEQRAFEEWSESKHFKLFHDVKDRCRSYIRI